MTTTKYHLQQLADIKRQLRAGVRPAALTGSVHLDGGSQREAYVVNGFVVKDSNTGWCWGDSYCSADSPCFSCKARLGIGLPVRKAPTVRVTYGDRDSINYRVYDIQRRYDGIRCNRAAYDRWHDSDEARNTVNWDLHAGNIGIDHRGRFVAFDW